MLQRNRYRIISYKSLTDVQCHRKQFESGGAQMFLADCHTNGRGYATVLRLSSSVTLCIVAKRCFLEQKLLLTAYRKSYMRNRLAPK